MIHDLWWIDISKNEENAFDDLDEIIQNQVLPTILNIKHQYEYEAYKNLPSDVLSKLQKA